jgi:ribosome-binding factor A
MSSRKISFQDLRSACAEPGPDDGRDPRLDRREGTGKVPNRKALQLCAQVARTLASVLAECGDDVLRDMVVESVVPAPNAVRLLVTLSLTDAAETAQAAQRLEHARGKLRSEVAAAVNRRRTPDLVFRVVGSEH